MNNRILLRIAAENNDTDIDTSIDTEAEEENNDENDDNDFQFDFDNLFNNDNTPKSDIEKMVTEPIDMDPFDPYTESEE